MYTKKFGIHRVSTTSQKESQNQDEYFKGKSLKIIRLVGSAYNKTTTIDFIKKHLSRGKTKKLMLWFSAGDRFSRNVSHCEELLRWLDYKDKELCLIFDKKYYDFKKNYHDVIEYVKLGQSESEAKSTRARQMIERGVFKRSGKKSSNLLGPKPFTDDEKYFIKQIVSTKEKNGFLIPAEVLRDYMLGCGVLNFTINNINYWRHELRDFKNVDYISCRYCTLSNLYFAHVEGTKEEFSWMDYRRFVPSIEVAKNMAINFPWLNAIWEKEEPLEDFTQFSEAIESIEDETDDFVEVPSASAPARDIILELEKARDLYKNGTITEKEFNILKEKILE